MITMLTERVSLRHRTAEYNRIQIYRGKSAINSMHYVRFNLWSVGKSCLINLSLLFASSTLVSSSNSIQFGLVWICLYGWAIPSIEKWMKMTGSNIYEALDNMTWLAHIQNELLFNLIYSSIFILLLAHSTHLWFCSKFEMLCYVFISTRNNIDTAYAAQQSHHTQLQ